MRQQRLANDFGLGGTGKASELFCKLLHFRIFDIQSHIILYHYSTITPFREGPGSYP
jgi:hypothetical protein